MTQMLFKSIVDQVLAGSFSDLLNNERRAELKEIGVAWDFYDGHQTKYIKQYRGEKDAEYEDKDKPTFNYVKSVVDEYVNGVFGKPVTVSFDNELYQEIFDGIVSAISFQTVTPFLGTVQKIAEISDTCLVMARWDKEKQRVYWEEFRGEFVTFIADPDNPKEVGTVIIAYDYDTGNPDSKKRILKRVEIWDSERVEVFLWNETLKIKEEILSESNIYGRIPGVIFQPEHDDNSFYGKTAVNDMVKINQVYNNLWTALVRICVYQSFSLLVTNLGDDVKIEVAPTRMLDLGDAENAKADYITPNPLIGDVKDVLEGLRKELQDFSKVPVSTFQASTGAGMSVDSGYALRIKRIPIETLWANRKSSYGPSYANLAKLSILVDQMHREVALVDPDQIDVSIKFSDTELLLSPQEQTLVDQQDLRYNLKTPVDFMLRENPTMTRDQAKEKIKANQEEMTEIYGDQFGEEDGNLGETAEIINE